MDVKIVDTVEKEGGVGVSVRTYSKCIKFRVADTGDGSIRI